MKFSVKSRFRRQGFTLVELLVVMGIIAILAAVAIAGMSSAIRFAKRTKATTMANQISTAVQNYYTEYGVYPTSQPNETKDEFYDGTAGPGAWPQLVYTLCGNISPLTGNAGGGSGFPNENSRNIAYLTPTRSDIDPGSGALANPFGLNSPAPYFSMVVDSDYSGVCGDSCTIPPDFSGTNVVNPGTNPVPGGVAVWSSCDQPVAGNSRSSAWAHTY